MSQALGYSAEDLGSVPDGADMSLGEIEALPLPDASADVIMSNCVINLSPDKHAVYREAYRVLAPGGRLAISDIIALKPLPTAIANNLAMLAGCVAEARTAAEIEAILLQQGFEAVRVEKKSVSAELVEQLAPGLRLEQWVSSANISAVKPA